MKIKKNDWFLYLLLIFFCLFFVFVLIILISPHHDVKNRGLSFCTQNLINDLEDCSHKFACSANALWQNTKCDISIIIQGFENWIQDKQPNPWCNYIFEPELPLDSYFDKEEIEEYMKEYPDTKEQIKKLNKLRKDLENAQNEVL